MSHLEQQRGFADARLPADKHDRSGNDSPAQNAVELADAGGQARGLRFVNLPDRQCFSGCGQISAGSLGARIRGGGCVGFEAVPGSAIRALAEPFRVNAPAMITKELRADFGHEGQCSGFEGGNATGETVAFRVVTINAPVAWFAGSVVRRARFPASKHAGCTTASISRIFPSRRRWCRE